MLSRLERFEAKFIPEPMSGCWLWTGSADHRGYGKFAPKERPGSPDWAHRAAYELYIGPIPDGSFVCHRCDNPACVNPAHLFAASHADNMRDMTCKGRSARGSRHAMAILSEGDINPIRRRLSSGERPASIAAEYGVARQTINNIRSGHRWGYVAEEYDLDRSMGRED